MSSILRIPLEVLDTIAVFCACPTVDGPPQSIVSLLLTCKTIYSRLRIPPSTLPYDCTDSAGLWSGTAHDGNASLWARIYHRCFNTAAIERRAYRPTLVEFAEQLVRNCHALQYIKRKAAQEDFDVDDPDLHDALAVVYLILCENEIDDRNKNRVEEAGTYSLVMKILERGLARQPPDVLWPKETSETIVLLWVAWFLSSRGE